MGHRRGPDSSKVYLSGCFTTVNATTHAVRTKHSAGGTTNSQFQTGGEFVAAYSATTGPYLPAFRLDVSGSSGIRGMTAGLDGCVWFGGDLTRATRANGTNQTRGGLTRHCDSSFVVDAIKPSTPTGLTVTASGAMPCSPGPPRPTTSALSATRSTER